MQESAGELAAFVDEVLAATGAAKVDIVGHSEGSLMPNYYVKFLGGAPRGRIVKVDDYVGMTPLWDGTNLAGLGTITGGGEAERHRTSRSTSSSARAVSRARSSSRGLTS